MTVSDDDINDLLNEELYERRVKALFLRNAGATVVKIADELKVSTATVRRDLDIAERQYLDKTPEQRRARQMSVLADMRRANYPAMMRGDTDAANVILRGLKQEASLFGLFPKVLEVPGINDVEFANESAALIARIAAIDPQSLKEITRGTSTVEPLTVEVVPVDDRVKPSREDAPGAGPRDPGAVHRPGSDEALGPDGADAARPEDVPRLPRHAGDPNVRPPESGAGDGTPDSRDDGDDGWSNIGS